MSLADVRTSRGFWSDCFLRRLLFSDLRSLSSSRRCVGTSLRGTSLSRQRPFFFRILDVRRYFIVFFLLSWIHVMRYKDNYLM